MANDIEIKVLDTSIANKSIKNLENDENPPGYPLYQNRILEFS